jgi:hypothetical protein
MLFIESKLLLAQLLGDTCRQLFLIPHILRKTYVVLLRKYVTLISYTHLQWISYKMYRIKEYLILTTHTKNHFTATNRRLKFFRLMCSRRRRGVLLWIGTKAEEEPAAYIPFPEKWGKRSLWILLHIRKAHSTTSQESVICIFVSIKISNPKSNFASTKFRF